MSTITQAAPGLRASVSGTAAVRELETRLRNTQQSVVRQRTTAGLLALGALLTLALAAMATVDYFAELSVIWRAVWMLSTLAAVVAAGLAGWKRFVAPYSLARAAADAEGHVAGFGQRLRTTLDYEQQNPAPAQADKTLLAALQRDTFEVARKTNWDEVVDVRPVFLTFSAAAVVALALGIALVSLGDYRVAMGRAMLLPLEYTTVTFTPLSQTVRIGESVDINANVTGRPIESAVVRYRAADTQDEWTTVDLVCVAADGPADVKADTAPRLHGELAANLNNLQHDLEFEVVAGPRALPLGKITVLQPLTLDESQARIVPPAYTARPEETATGLDLKVLEGSTIELVFKLNRPAAEAKATSVDGTLDIGDVPLTISENAVRGTLADLRKSASWTITAKAADGMILDPQRLTIRVQLDRKPEVKFIEPPEELVVTATTEVPMSIEAGDDIGLYKVGILFQINDGEMHVLCEQDAAGSTEPFSLSQVLLLEEHQLSYKDSVTYYAFAEDNYFDEVRRTTTPLRFIDIRPFQTAFQIVEGEGSCKGSTTLEELIVRQRQNLSEAFAAQEQSPLENGTAISLGENQSDLLEKTREFEEGIAKLAGPVPTLASAVVAMQSAVDTLAARQLPAAVAAEKQALADLIRARENVRKKLSQSSSQSASACRKFDREQRQKLRMPEKKKEQDKQQQIADLRSKLDDLAQRERKWSQECQQCNSKSSSSKPSQSSKSQSAQGQSSSQQQSEQAKSSSSQKEGAQQQQAGQNQGDQPSEPRTPAEIAQDQEKMRAELDKLRERLEKLTAAGAAARDQARQADESMEQGLQELEKQDGLAAAKEGERSAEQLERLAEHLAAMSSRDFGQRLDQAQKLARKLADKQQSLEQSQQSGKSGNGKAGQGSAKNEAAEQARHERGLAGEADLLADQLEALERDASRERGGVQRKLRDVQAENPPREISSLMRQAAGDLESKHPDQAGRGVAQAQRRLDELSRALGDIQSQFSQPDLEELIALEQQLANLMQQSQRAGQGKEKVTAAQQEKWSELDNRLAGPAKGDKRLAKALHRMREGVTPEGHYSWLELADFTGPREVAKALQMKIQEAILAGALQDADQPIPIEYKALVEKYYRALSDDLR